MAAQLPTLEEIEAAVERVVARELAKLRPGGAPATGLLTSDQAAELLGVTPKTVRRWARDGLLAGTKRGDEWRFARADVEAYRAAGPAGGLAAAMVASLRPASGS